jgi:hypothetical protein
MLGRGQRRTRQEERQRGAFSHAAAHEPLQDGHFGQRGEIHERPHDR